MARLPRYVSDGIDLVVHQAQWIRRYAMAATASRAADWRRHCDDLGARCAGMAAQLRGHPVEFGRPREPKRHLHRHLLRHVAWRRVRVLAHDASLVTYGVA